jgi:ATP-binding cassette, subfamily B (MDR/TAP), member 1
MRFYEPTAGGLLIDGTSISELDINWLRNNISLVQQQSILFNETIFRNISFGQRDYLRVTKEQVRACIDLAALQSTIKEMPKGLETAVGSGGSALSGGQKQRIAVARARLRDTPILILDESTSALDYTSRKAVMEAIRDWRRGKTTIIITHNISQIREEDFVYVLENGQIIQDGYMNTLPALERIASVSPASPTGATSVNFDFDLAERQGHIERNNRYSNIAAVTRQSIMRKDSIEMHLDRIPESPNKPIPPPNDSTDRSNLPVRQKRSSASNMLDDIRGRPMMQAGQRSSRHFIPMKDTEGRLLHSSTPKALTLHRALSRSGRPMSMHQAMTRNSIYGDSMLPSNRQALNASPILRNSRNGSTAASSAFSALQKQPELLVTETKEAQRIASIRSILSTVWPNLSAFKRAQLILGFFSAIVHAGGPPVFSYIFSQLLGTFFIKEGAAHKALIYSMAILGIAVIDALSDGGTHYLLEGCGQAWVDSLRLQAFERVLGQPKA